MICVDRDDDVGEKTGISTPVIGRDACIEAAQRLALEDPEDADSNSIFAAIKTYEDLISKGYQVEVATITGVKNRGVQADEKILQEARIILEKFDAKKMYKEYDRWPEIAQDSFEKKFEKFDVRI